MLASTSPIKSSAREALVIEYLRIGRTAYFYKRRKRLSDAAITALFRSLRASASAPSQNLFRANRAKLEDATYSAICFSFERSPAFLDAEAGATERVYGFILMVEKRNFVAVIKAGLDLPTSFKTEYFDKIDHERVERAIARHDAIFEKMRLRNMSTSKFSLRSKTLEARDLANAVPTSSASRFVPQGYSVRRPDGHYSATPNTGRISNRADKTNYEGIVRWTAEIMDLLAADDGNIAPFIRNFARPLDLAALPREVRPTYLAIDVPGFSELLFEAEERIRLVRQGQEGFVELAKAEIDPVLADLDQAFPVRNVRSESRILDPGDEGQIGSLRVGKTRVGLSSFALPSIDGLSVEHLIFPVGADPDRMPLARYLDRTDLFTVLFTDHALAYIDGTLYRDEALLGGGAAFLRRLQVAPVLAHTTSEKGTFAPDQEAFDNESVFRAVVDDIANDADVLLCDDLGDEWADFIGISTLTNPTMVSFYHAKHGARSLSASAFHDAVGQAIKNLGRMALSADVMPAKYESWSAVYRNAGVVTAIPRMLRGGGREDVEQKIGEVRDAPDLLKRVFIVTSSLSRAQVEAVFVAAAAGQQPSAHFVQLYWLLQSYFSACTEIGAAGYVICQP